MKNLSKKLLILLIILVIVITATITYFAMKNIKSVNNDSLKDAKSHSITNVPVDTSNWDLNKVHIEYDDDGIPVPVPMGFVGSRVTTNNNETTPHDIVYDDSVKIPITFGNQSSQTYPWYLDENNIWISSNQGKKITDSVLVSDTFTIGTNEGIQIEYSVSCEDLHNSDYLYYTITNIATNSTFDGENYETGNNDFTRIYGTSYGTDYNSLTYITKNHFLLPGTYNIRFTYHKSNSTDEGLDSRICKISKQNISDRYRCRLAL